MPKTLRNVTQRPRASDAAVDVIGQVLEAVHLRTAIFGKVDFGVPWRLQVPERAHLSFYVVARGSAWLEVRGESPRPLSTGDAVILPLGSAHELRDIERSDAFRARLEEVQHAAGMTGPNDNAVLELNHRFLMFANLTRVLRVAPAPGPVTSIIIGHFTLGSAPRNALLASLPPAIHLPAGAVSASPQLAGLVPLILSESGSPGAGSSIVLARLADLLFVHALRFWSSTVDASVCGLGAVADPAIGAALRLIHARPAEPWTVERLATSVAMSRSAFAARFTELVGEPPLQYLAHWRMTIAAQRLREDDAVIADVAQAVGYANPVAFSKAFARMQGVGPGTFRRQERLALRAPR